MYALLLRYSTLFNLQSLSFWYYSKMLFIIIIIIIIIFIYTCFFIFWHHIISFSLLISLVSAATRSRRWSWNPAARDVALGSLCECKPTRRTAAVQRAWPVQRRKLQISLRSMCRYVRINHSLLIFDLMN
jgi:hypothetical protein